MAQDTMTKTAADYDGLVAQVTALRGDMAQLARETRTAAMGNGKAVAQDLGNRLASAAHGLEGRGQEAEQAFERAVTTNPWLALGVAAGLGLVLGALTRR